MECAYVVYFESDTANTVHPVRVFSHPFDAIQYCNEKAFRMVINKDKTVYINSKGRYYIKMIVRKGRRSN
jgi:hypothetical protein